MNASEAATFITDKLRESSVANFSLAVFVIGQKVKTTKPTSQLFAEAMHKHPDRLAGIYSIKTRLEWIKQDLVFMGMK